MHPRRWLCCVVVGLAIPSALPGADKPSDTARGDRMLAGYFRRQTRLIADAALADVKTLADWKKKRPKLRRQFLDMIGLWPPPPRTDLKPVITGKVGNDHFTVEKLHFQSSPGLYVTANLYLPKKARLPAPAILYVCGHANTVIGGVSYGSKVNYQHHPAWFAEHGYVCLILDTLELGESNGDHHGTYRRGMWWWQTLGYTPAGIECWNAMRALDYLATRKEVDAKRIGVTGRSGGGATSWWLAAADDRPQCIIPVAGIGDLEAHVVAGAVPRFRQGVISGHCDCMYFVNTYRWDFTQVMALCAPRPLLLGNSDQDEIFPVAGYRRPAAKVRRIYDLYGAGDHFALLETKGPHKDTPELRQGAFRWMNRWLKGDARPVSEPGRPRLTPRQLKVFERIPADSRNPLIHETWRKPARPEVPATGVDTWWKKQAPAWRAALLDRVFRGWPAKPPALNPRLAADVKRDGLRLRAWDFVSEEGVGLRLFVLTAAETGKPARLTLEAVDEAGWAKRVDELGPAFKDALQLPKEPKRDAATFEALRTGLRRRKNALAWVAPRGVGPTRWSEIDSFTGKPCGHQILRRFALLGQTLDGQRVWDVRRAVACLRTVADFKSVPVDLRGKGEMAGIVLYAALFEPAVARLDLWQPPASHRQGPIFLNVRRILDMPQAVALAFPREIHLHVKDAAEAKAWDWPLRLQKALEKAYLEVEREKE